MRRLLTFPRLSMIFLGLFAVAVSGVFAYEWLVTRPGERCEDEGKWWDADGRVCAQPISIAEITGRPNPGQRAAASDAANRDLLRVERDLAVERELRDADAERQREALAAEQRGR